MSTHTAARPVRCPLTLWLWVTRAPAGYWIAELSIDPRGEMTYQVAPGRHPSQAEAEQAGRTYARTLGAREVI